MRLIRRSFTGWMVALLLTVATYAIVSIATATPVAAADPAQEEGTDAVVLQLGDRVITQSEFDQLFTRFVQGMAARQALPADESAVTMMRDLRSTFLDQLAKKEVLLAEAESRGITVPADEIDTLIAQAAQSFPDEASFNQALVSLGLENESDLRAYIGQNETLNRVLDQSVAGYRDQ